MGADALYVRLSKWWTDSQIQDVQHLLYFCEVLYLQCLKWFSSNNSCSSLFVRIRADCITFINVQCNCSNILLFSVLSFGKCFWYNSRTVLSFSLTSQYIRCISSFSLVVKSLIILKKSDIFPQMQIMNDQTHCNNQPPRFQSCLVFITGGDRNLFIYYQYYSKEEHCDEFQTLNFGVLHYI